MICDQLSPLASVITQEYARLWAFPAIGLQPSQKQDVGRSFNALASLRSVSAEGLGLTWSHIRASNSAYHVSRTASLRISRSSLKPMTWLAIAPTHQQGCRSIG